MISNVIYDGVGDVERSDPNGGLFRIVPVGKVSTGAHLVDGAFRIGDFDIKNSLELLSIHAEVREIVGGAVTSAQHKVYSRRSVSISFTCWGAVMHWSWGTDRRPAISKPSGLTSWGRDGERGMRGPARDW